MNYDNCQIVVGVSGGKDSTAMCLNLFERGYSKSDFVRVFADTGWETFETYRYLDSLEKTIGEIKRIRLNVEIVDKYRETIEQIETMLGFESPFVRLMFKKEMIPSRVRKYCTTEMKIKPFKQFFDDLEIDAVNLVGIRRQESPRRAKMTEWEWNDNFDCWTHRPIIDWTENDVIDIHHRFNLVPNSLYLNGSTRVGCYPCIYSNKQEIKLLNEQRLKIIEIIENVLGLTFFHSKDPTVQTIRQVHEWSKTSFGGKQYQLFDTTIPTCEKWGLCGI